MKVLSNASEYGLRALLYMVSKGEKQEYVSIREMAEYLGISFPFLTKILQTLTQGNILVSYRGPKGGVAFNISPEKILLSEVVLLLEGRDFFDQCLLGLPNCGECAPCPMHAFWKDIKSALRYKLEHTTLAEMGRSIETGNLRLIP